MKHKIIQCLEENRGILPINLLKLNYDCAYDVAAKPMFHIRPSKSHQTEKSIIRYPFLKTF